MLASEYFIKYLIPYKKTVARPPFYFPSWFNMVTESKNDYVEPQNDYIESVFARIWTNLRKLADVEFLAIEIRTFLCILELKKTFFEHHSLITCYGLPFRE